MKPAEVAKTTGPDGRERQAIRAERWIAWGATTAVLGLALSLIDDQGMSGLVTLLGLTASLVGLHRFGRSGPRPRSSASSALVVATQHGDSDITP